MNRSKVYAVIIAILTCASLIGAWYIPNYQLQISDEGFGIFLRENDEPVISDKDIIWYNKTSHEIKLTEEGAEKIKALEVPISGRPFVIKLNGKEIYEGAFWTSLSSISYSGIVIDTLEVQLPGANNTLKIEKGYPNPEFFEGIDPRDNPEILDYFQEGGKLVY